MLSGAGALWGAAAVLAIMFVGSTQPTPLYVIYRQVFQLSGVMVTLVYAAYVIGGVSALLFLGRLSDEIGRRRALLPAVAVGVLSTAVFLVTTHTAMLFVARALSGLAIGVAAGATTAWIAELYRGEDRQTPAAIATGANLLGLAVGPLGAGLLAEHAPSPMRLTFVVYLALLAIAALLVWLAQETVEKPKPLARVDLRPRLGVPREIRAQFVPAAITAFALMSLLGFYSAITPSLLQQTLHESSRSVSGAVVATLFFVGTVGTGLLYKVSSRSAMLVGIGLLIPSLVLLVVAQRAASMALLMAATVVGGIALGLAYRGSLEVVNEIAPEDKRAEVVSSYMIACNLGIAVPVIGVGVLTELTNARLADLVFAITIAVFAAVALVTGVKFAPR